MPRVVPVFAKSALQCLAYPFTLPGRLIQWCHRLERDVKGLALRLDHLTDRLKQPFPLAGGLEARYADLVAEKRELIDYAFTRFAFQSFADLGGNWGTPPGGYTFYTLEKYQTPTGYLVDIEFYDDVFAQRETFPGLTLVGGGFAAPEALDLIQHVDVVYAFDVLYIQAHWQDLLRLYAGRTRCFLISNIQFTCFPRTVNLIDLGKAEYFKYVPLNEGDDGSWFDTLDAVNPEFGTTNREFAHCWHWAMTDDDLIGEMKSLGFRLYYLKTIAHQTTVPGAESRAFMFLKE